MRALTASFSAICLLGTSGHARARAPCTLEVSIADYPAVARSDCAVLAGIDGPQDVSRDELDALLVAALLSGKLSRGTVASSLFGALGLAGPSKIDASRWPPPRRELRVSPRFSSLDSASWAVRAHHSL